MKSMRDLLLERKDVAAADVVLWPCNHCGRPTEAGPFAQAIQHHDPGDGRGPMGKLAICPGCYEELRGRDLGRRLNRCADDARLWGEFKARYLRTGPDASAMRDALKSEFLAKVYQTVEYERLLADWERIIKEREAKRPRKAKGDDSGAGF